MKPLAQAWSPPGPAIPTMAPATAGGSTTGGSAGHQILTELFEANLDVIFGFVYARCGSRLIAEDVSSETFAEAARVVAQGRADEVGRAWLIHVARLRLIDHWRKTDRHRRKLERLTSFRSNDELDGLGTASDPRVFEALQTLSIRQRTAVVLRYLDDYSVSEVAEAMELSYSATESLLARGRRALLTAYTQGSNNDEQ